MKNTRIKDFQKNIMTGLSIVGFGLLAAGCGNGGNVPIPAVASTNQTGAACINLLGGPAYLSFTVNGAAAGVLPNSSVYPTIPTLMGGAIQAGGLLGLPAGQSAGVVTNIMQTAVSNGTGTGMLATASDPIHLVDGSFTLMSNAGVGGQISGQGQIMVTPWRLQDFQRYAAGTSFTGYPAAYPNFYSQFSSYPAGISPYFNGGVATGAGMPGQEVLCVTQIGFALKINTTGAGGYAPNTLYLGNAWVTGIYKGQMRGFMMQW